MHEATVTVDWSYRGWGPPEQGSSGGVTVPTLDYEEKFVPPPPPPKDKATQVGE